MKLVNIKRAELLIERNSKVFIRFYAPWCPITVENEPTWKKFAAENEKDIVFLDVNIDDNNLWEEDGNEKYAIKLTPTYCYYINSKLAWRKDNKQNVKTFIDVISK